MSLLRRWLGGGEPADTSDADARVIEQLQAAGADLSKPLPVEHFLYFRTERPARQVVALLAGLGGELRIGQVGRRWAVQLTLPMRISRERIAAIRSQLEAVAREHDGEYDGWGSPVG